LLQGGLAEIKNPLSAQAKTPGRPSGANKEEKQGARGQALGDLPGVVHLRLVSVVRHFAIRL